MTLIFGPEIISYDRGVGPSLIQYVQMYPGPITTIGGFIVMQVFR